MTLQCREWVQGGHLVPQVVDNIGQASTLDPDTSSDHRKKELPLTTDRVSSALPRDEGWKSERDENRGRCRCQKLGNMIEPQAPLAPFAREKAAKAT